MYFGRGPNKYQNPYTITDMYKAYIADKEEDSPYHVSLAQYKAICGTFYKEMMKHILEKAGTFKMPYNMGKIFVDKKKVPFAKKKKLAIDWASTNKYGKVIYHLNEHSKGYKYIFCWEKLTYISKNKKHYRFIPTRYNKRRLAELVKSGDYDYFERYS